MQHNDAVDMLHHVKTFSEHSTGIETVNIVFDNDSAANKGEPDPGERIPVAWGAPHGDFYVLPPAVQMEALALTVDALRERLGIPDNWIQVMQHPDRSRAELANRWFFVLHTNGHLYVPRNEGRNLVLPTDGWQRLVGPVG